MLDVIFLDMGMSDMDPSVKRWLVSERVKGTSGHQIWLWAQMHGARAAAKRFDSEEGDPRSAEGPRERPFPF